MAIFKKTRSVTGEDQFTDSVKLEGYFNVSISGTWQDATVTIQRSFNDGSTWYNVDQFTENTQIVGFEPEGRIRYRIGVKLGDFGTGTVEVRLSQ